MAGSTDSDDNAPLQIVTGAILSILRLRTVGWRSMRILLIGHRGQLGTALLPLLSQVGEVYPVDRGELDITDEKVVATTAEQVQPDLIINAAAYTSVDAAEDDNRTAMAVNGDGPGFLARTASTIGAAIIHYSTDFVFDGLLGQPYSPDDRPAPISVYGASKLAGEHAVRESGARGIIIRTSWLYGPTGHNFVRTMLRLASERDEVSVVADQRGCPTSTLVLARWTAAIIARLNAANTWPLPIETLHLACEGDTTWHGLASAAIRAAGSNTKIIPITASDFGAPASRPKDSRLDSRDSLRRFGLEPERWRDALAEVIAAIPEQHYS